MQALGMVLLDMEVLRLIHLELQHLPKVLLVKAVMEHTMQTAMVEQEVEAGMVVPDVTQMVLATMIKVEAVVQAEYIPRRPIQTELLIHQRDNLVSGF